MDERNFIAEAIELAAGTFPHPNPRVGAIVLAGDGTVVGRGAHARRGEPHAEVLALAEAGDRSRGATVYVTLEPCDHTGSTPPCTEVLIEAGVGGVVVGAGDPDARVSGRGIARLREAGIEVVADVAPDAVEAADPGYFHHRRTGRPRFTLKSAMTLDGQVAARDGTSQWITSEPARTDAHWLRANSDAVMVGAGTLLEDDPRLTARIDGFDGRQPRPVLITGSRPLPPERSLWGRNPLVFSPTPRELPGEVIVSASPDGVDLADVAAELGKREVIDVLVEGGPTLAGSLWRAGLVDRLVVYVGGMVAGGIGRGVLDGIFGTMADARPVRVTGVTRLGPDLRIDAEVA